MKNFRKKIVRILIIALLLQIVPECAKMLNLELTSVTKEEFAAFIDDFSLGEETVVSAATDYGSLFSTDPEIISRINYATSNYGPGQYFTKNGYACTCHGKYINHVNSPWNCNCLRYVNIHGSVVDLQAVQCFGYAMYMQMCILGTTQFKSSNFTYLYGSNSAMSGSQMERFFLDHASQIHPGTHMRCKYSTHSLVIMAVDYANGKVTYIDNNNIGNCLIRNFTTLTWDEFAKRYYNINYLSVYKNYYSLYSGAPDPALIAQIQSKLPPPQPTRRPATPTPTPSPADYPIGLYRVNADPHLNLREDTYTSSKKISELPDGITVEIFSFVYNKGGHHWGLIDTEEGSGWSSMGFLELVAVYTPTPTPTYMPADFETGTYEVRPESLYVREKQSTNSASLGKLKAGDMVDMMIFVISDNDSKWGYVSLEEENLHGWVSMDYMDIVPTNTPAPTNTPSASPSPTPTNTPIATETPTATPSPTATPVPTKAPNSTNSAGTTRAIVVINIILVCVAAEAVVFMYLKKRKNRKWDKKVGKTVNKQFIKEIISKFKKKRK